MRKKATFSRVEYVYNELEKKNLPIFLDILYNHLDTGGDGLFREYTERFAKSQYLDLSQIEVRNTLFEKFYMLRDPFQRYAFGKRFVTLHEDGSFEMNELAIDEYYLQKWKYTITQDKQDAIEVLCKSIDELGIPLESIKTYFSRQPGGETKPIGRKIYALLSAKPMSTLL